MRKTWSPAGPLRRALTGIATTVVEGPTGTSTRTEAPGAGAWLGIRARTSALRVAGSIRASTATIRAVSGRGSSAAYTATGSPGCSSAATAWATVKSTLAAASTPCSVVSSVPSFRYCPGCTSEIPTRAWNGARIVFFAMMARVRASCASATSRAARAWSTSSWDVACSVFRRSSRARVVCARSAWACCAASSASSTETSRATSIVPASTTRPGASVTCRTVPESSLRRVIELSARTVPTDVVVGRYCRARATARVTDSMGSGWLAAAASAFRAEACFQATRLPAVRASVPNSTADPTQPRLFMTKGLRIRSDLPLPKKVKHGPLCTRRVGKPQIDIADARLHVSKRSRSRHGFNNTAPSYSSVMNQIAKGFPWSGPGRAWNCEGTTWGSAAAGAAAPHQCEEGAGQHYGARVHTGEVVEQPSGYQAQLGVHGDCRHASLTNQILGKFPI